MTDENPTADMMSRGKAVLATVREDVPIVKEAISELRTEPQSALSKLLAVAKDIWAKIVEVGLITAIVTALKTFLGAAATTVTSRAQAVVPSAIQAHPQSEELTEQTDVMPHGEGSPLLKTEAGETA